MKYLLTNIKELSQPKCDFCYTLEYSSISDNVLLKDNTVVLFAIV